MKRWIRLLLLYFEGITTIIAGLVTLLAPVMMMPVLTAAEAGAAAEDVARMLGVGWIIIGLLVCLVPQLRDARSLRLVLLPVLIGDVLHISALWPWDAPGTLTHIAPSVVYLINRSTIALWPEGFLRPQRSVT